MNEMNSTDTLFKKDDMVYIDYTDYPSLAQRGNDGFVGYIISTDIKPRKPYSPISNLEESEVYYTIVSENGEEEIVNQNYLRLI